MINEEHMKAVAKRMVKKILFCGESAVKDYLQVIGWTEAESNWIVNKAKSYMEKE